MCLCPVQSSSGNILDDEELIEALRQSKEASVTVKARLHATTVSSGAIQTAHSEDASVPNQTAAIFYAAQALSSVNPIYQLSLDCFRKLLLRSLKTATKSDIPEVCTRHLCHLPARIHLQ